MSEKNTGGPAFPREDYQANGNNGKLGQEGMTLRDYFAAKAMQGAMATFINGAPADSATDAKLAKAAYMIADAMLKARES